MNSPGHRANLLSPHFTEIGIATAQGVYQGQATTFVVQEFGSPVIAMPEPIVAAASSSPQATSTPKIATTTPKVTPPAVVAVVKGEATTSPPEVLTIIHEDPEFIAVKAPSTTPAPSEYSVARQSTWWEQLLASPKTALSYSYLVLAVLVFLALILMIILEAHTQRPMGAVFALVALILMAAILWYVGGTPVIVEGIQLSL